VANPERTTQPEERPPDHSKQSQTLFQFIAGKLLIAVLPFLGTLAILAAWAVKQAKSRSTVISP
jgi:hypothetical protein